MKKLTLELQSYIFGEPGSPDRAPTDKEVWDAITDAITADVVVHKVIKRWESEVVSEVRFQVPFLLIFKVDCCRTTTRMTDWVDVYYSEIRGCSAGLAHISHS